MSDIKSAWEIASEKVEKLGKPSEEELKRLEYEPMGNKLAARYVQDSPSSFDADLTKYKGTGVRKYVISGAQDIFLRNILLPRSERDRDLTKRAMAGLKLLKENRNLLNAVLDRISNLLNYYTQARQQTYQQFKSGFESKLQEATKSSPLQLGAKTMMAPEQHPQFLEEWRKISSQLDAQYEKVLEEHKQQIIKIA